MSITDPRPALMVQGTTSDAGKSLMVTGLCRVLARRGISVAPFKPQNMALNSAVTEDGGEIGRAQALQAEAAGIAPHTDMNPVLLKPSSDCHAQVIVHGHAVDHLDATTYHHYKTHALDAVMSSFQRLQAHYQCVIVEGAGSPAEINLRDRDIANMGFAEPADCPVVLVADIDRGGVFAHLVGTLDLLSSSEQDRVLGFIINRFRGDLSLLQPGLDWLEQRTGKPVFGVLPYLQDLRLDAEDALRPAPASEESARDALRIVVPALPRISNHTDFEPLQDHPQVQLTFVGPGDPLPGADLIILPGSKNVRGDLAFLRQQGWDQGIARHLRYGGKVLGICGGYQMLGEHIDDPEGIEDEPGSSVGLGWLPTRTRLLPGKHLRQVRGTLFGTAQLQGYEIHCGETQVPTDLRALAHLEQGGPDGLISDDDQIAGTYVHGLFDAPEACAALLRWAGLHKAKGVDRAARREADIERLADSMEANLDLDALL